MTVRPRMVQRKNPVTGGYDFVDVPGEVYRNGKFVRVPCVIKANDPAIGELIQECRLWEGA